MSEQTTPPADPDSDRGPAAPERVESDRPKAGVLFVSVLVSAVALVAIVLGIDQYFRLAVLEEVELKVLRAENPALRQLRAEEDSRLSRYQWVDQKRAVVRIPLQRARELVLEEWAARPSGFVPASTSPGAPASAEPAKPSGAPQEPPKATK